MGKLLDKFFNRFIEGKFVAESGDDFSEVYKNINQFDGEVKVSYSSGNAYIASADIPAKSGIYKLVYESGSTKEVQGLLVFKKVSASEVHYSGLYRAIIFRAQESGTISNLQITLNAISSGTKLYLHTVRLVNEVYIMFKVISPSSSAVANLDDIYAILDNGLYLNIVSAGGTTLIYDGDNSHLVIIDGLDARVYVDFADYEESSFNDTVTPL